MALPPVSKAQRRASNRTPYRLALVFLQGQHGVQPAKGKGIAQRHVDLGLARLVRHDIERAFHLASDKKTGIVKVSVLP